MSGTVTPWDLIVAMVAACLLGAVACWAAMRMGQVHRETAEFVDELADLDRPRPEDFPIAPRYDEPADAVAVASMMAAPELLKALEMPGEMLGDCACLGDLDGPGAVHGRVSCSTRHVCPDPLAGLILAGAAIRQAGLAAPMERMREADDTAGWRYDRATGALIAPEHTRYFDWPELSEEFRPIPAPIPPRSITPRG